MAWFITRVELHYATDTDYTFLHAVMAINGFLRTITSDERVTYHLPPAEYFREGNLTRHQVLEFAKAAAKVTGRKFSIVVTETPGVSWFGLEKVDTPSPYRARLLTTT